MKTKNKIKMFVTAGLVLAACGNDLAGPPDVSRVCDREKRAVWSALGYADAPPQSLMSVGEWNLDGQTYYFMVFGGDPTTCHVLRA
jgi:hypothetical protein